MAFKGVNFAALRHQVNGPCNPEGPDQVCTFTIRRGSFTLSAATLAEETPEGIAYLIASQTPDRAQLSRNTDGLGGHVYTWRIVRAIFRDA